MDALPQSGSEVRSRPASGPARFALGGAAGLAWAAALRGWMIPLAGAESKLTWRTIPFLLLPGAAVGASLGLAASRRAQAAPVPPWVRWTPLALAAPLVEPGAIRTLVTTGFGSGALGVIGIMMANGFAFRPLHAGDRPRGAARVALGALGLLGVAGTAAAGAVMAGPATRPKGILTALLGASLIAAASGAATLAYDGPRTRVGSR